MPGSLLVGRIGAFLGSRSVLCWILGATRAFRTFQGNCGCPANTGRTRRAYDSPAGDGVSALRPARFVADRRRASYQKRHFDRARVGKDFGSDFHVTLGRPNLDRRDHFLCRDWRLRGPLHWRLRMEGALAGLPVLMAVLAFLARILLQVSRGAVP